MKRIGLLIIACLLAGGCTSYYRVTDLNSQENYYTTRVEKKSSGAVVFKDSRTGSRVTLPSSQITRINKEEFTYADK